MCEAQTILNETSRQDEKSAWASHRPPAGYISGDLQMKLIPLTQSKFAIVDDEDFEELSKFKWCAKKNHYGGYCAIRNCYSRINKKQHPIYMHRQIMSCPRGKDIDHKNHNPLNNQRDNLRICTNRENIRNSRRRKDNTSGFKGVCWLKNRKKWMAYIQFDCKFHNLGYFNSKIEAACSYNNAAKLYFGEFANLNFVGI
jgi:hypothetical protein